MYRQIAILRPYIWLSAESWLAAYAVVSGRQTLFRQTLFRQTLFRQSAGSMTQYISSTLGTCRNSRNWEQIGMDRGVGCIESTALIEALR